MIAQKNLVKVALSLLSLLSITIAVPAFAGNMNNACQMGIDATRMAVQGAQFMGNNAQRNQDTMQSMVMAADTMAEMQRFNDAAMQMTDVRDMTMNLAGQMDPEMNVLDAFGQDMTADGMGGVEGMAAMAMDACQMQGMN